VKKLYKLEAGCSQLYGANANIIITYRRVNCPATSERSIVFISVEVERVTWRNVGRVTDTRRHRLPVTITAYENMCDMETEGLLREIIMLFQLDTCRK